MPELVKATSVRGAVSAALVTACGASSPPLPFMDLAEPKMDAAGGSPDGVYVLDVALEPREPMGNSPEHNDWAVTVVALVNLRVITGTVSLDRGERVADELRAALLAVDQTDEETGTHTLAHTCAVQVQSIADALPDCAMVTLIVRGEAFGGQT